MKKKSFQVFENEFFWLKNKYIQFVNVEANPNNINIGIR
jgi:hypothetical protein